MSMGIGLQIRQSQSLVMTPQLQQAIKLLQMSNLDLSEYVAQEVERNPLLEVAQHVADERRDRPDTPEATADAAPATGDLSTKLREDNPSRTEEAFDTGMENVYADESRAERQAEGAAALTEAAGPGGDEGSGWATMGKGGGGGFDSPEYDLEGVVASEMTLRDHLLEQIGMTASSHRIRAIAAYLVEYIDDTGYLRVDEETIAANLGANPADIEAGLTIVQGCDPSGVGARSLAECLRLQLRDRNRLDPAIGMLLDNLELLAKGKLPELMKLCGVGQEDMREMIEEVRALDPKPGSRFHSEIAQTMIPDVFVRRNAMGGWNVELNTDTLPRVLVNERYAAEISDGGAKVKSYLSECMQSANWLAKSLDQRARTILKVSSEIVRQQDGFFEYGIEELRPLNLKTVAEAIEMHESTVSRVTSNKYISTTRGVFELKFFFTAAIGAIDGGDSYSAESVRHKIKRMIDEEALDAVLSDDRIVKILRDDGVDIARRTVAKYRESMDIPSSVQRRRRKAETTL